MLSSFIFLIVIVIGASDSASETGLCHRTVPNNLPLSTGNKGWSLCSSLKQYLSLNGDLFDKICSHKQNFGLKCAKKFVNCGSNIGLCIEENPLYKSQLKLYKRLENRMANWSSFKFNSTLTLARRLRPPKSGDNGAFDALSNAWLRRHHPDAYKRIENSLKQRNINQATLSCIMIQFCRLLSSNDSNQGLHSSVQLIGRVKSIYSIWSKEQRILSKEEDTDTVTDQLSIKIVVNTEDDCYTVKNILAQKFMVLRIKDYILKPKSSGYKAIHVLLFGDRDDQFVEIQIVTSSMNEAQMGNDHSRYKESQDNLLYE